MRITLLPSRDSLGHDQLHFLRDVLFEARFFDVRVTAFLFLDAVFFTLRDAGFFVEARRVLAFLRVPFAAARFGAALRARFFRAPARGDTAATSGTATDGAIAADGGAGTGTSSPSSIAPAATGARMNVTSSGLPAVVPVTFTV